MKKDRPNITEEENYTEYFKEVRGHINETNYLTERGISHELQKIFEIGYDANWKHPKYPNVLPAPRVIIPTSKYSYVARLAKDNGSESDKKYKVIKIGNFHLFNHKALKSNEPVFITEGEIDALSIVEAGGQAVGLGGTSNNTVLENALRSTKTETVKFLLLLCLDNDNAGKEATKRIIKFLQPLGIPHKDVSEKVCGECKDPDEALMKNKESFKKCIDDIKLEATQAQTEESEEYYRYNISFHSNFIKHIEQNHGTISTGFDDLDTFFDGGLYSGLYVLGAVSGTGKTTFILQIADHIAKTGKDVLFFSGEMSTNEILARSYSRLSRELKSKDSSKYLTVRNILNFGKQRDKNIEAVITELQELYKQNIVYRMRVFEGRQKIQDIKDAITKHKMITGNSPVVFIDYLQIMDFSRDNNQSIIDIRHAIDATVSELRIEAIEYNIPIVIISSLNRTSYAKESNVEDESANEKIITLASFKESGGIEYGADIVMGLNTTKDGYNKEKQTQILNLKIIKNRHGMVHHNTDDKLSFAFHYKYNYFEETRLSQNENNNNQQQATNNNKSYPSSYNELCRKAVTLNAKKRKRNETTKTKRYK